MTEVELQEIEDTAKGLALVNDEELLEWLKKDVISLISEIRQCKNRLAQTDHWKRERNALLQMTNVLDEHPEGYEGPCLCKLCCSYGD